MDMIERVAKAIDPMPWSDLAESTWRKGAAENAKDRARDAARAALEAMREPTEEMQWAGYRAKEAVFSADALWNRDPANCFRAMIDAALAIRATPVSEREEG